MRPRWLVHLARECVPLFATCSALEIGEELGEAVVLVGSEGPCALQSPLAALCRYWLPVAFERPLEAHRDFDAVRQGARLCEAFAASKVEFVQVVGLRHATERLAAALEPVLCKALGLPTVAPDRHSPGLLVAIAQERLLAGVSSPFEAGGWDVLQFGARRALREWPDEALSRAGLKGLESKELFRLYDLDPDAVGHWLELGAAPGGITRVLAERARVTAIDKAPLDEALAANPNVRFVCGDARTVEVAGRDAAGTLRDQSFGGLFCDINGSPRVALAAVERFLPQLSRGAPIAVTLKLPTWESLATVVERACASFAASKTQLLTIRHLVSHRREVAVFARAA